jgi:hypothetical protein
VARGARPAAGRLQQRMNSKSFTRSFAAGEIAPNLFGRLDLVKFQTGLAKCLNFEVTPQGPVENRPGFAYVNRAKDTAAAPVLIPFTYNTDQSFALELGNGYIRFHTLGGTLLEAGKAISAITQANPGVFTSNAHGYSNGQWVFLSGIGGMSSLTGRWGIIAGATANTYTLLDLFGNPINTAALPAYTGGGAAARVFEIASPYASADLLDLHYVQSADVLTIAHVNYAPQELRRLGATSWSLTPVTLAPTIATPGTPTASAGGPGGGTATDHTYVVTAVASGTLEESLPSGAAGASCDLTVVGNFVDVTIPAVAGAIRYNVYKYPGSASSGVAGYIGQADGGSFRDTNITPDTSKTPPIAYSPFVAQGAIGSVTVLTSGANYGGAGPLSSLNVHLSISDPTGTGAVIKGFLLLGSFLGVAVLNPGRGYTSPTVVVTDTSGAGAGATFSVALAATANPQAVSYFEQRRCFGGSGPNPQHLWATRSGTESNMSYSIPAQDDDAITARIVAREAQTVRHLVPLGDLMALTSSGVWRIAASDGGALTPATFSVKPQSYVGASKVQPVVTSDSVLYAQERGNHVREVTYKWNLQRYTADDMSVLSPHLFDFRTIKQFAFSTTPYQVLWAVRDDGVLLGMTYQPEHEVKAWHQHNTQGSFKSVCAIPEGTEDGIYSIVQRTVQGQNWFYIERLHTRQFAALKDAFFVDSGLTYSGAPVATVSGLWHLEGQSVSVLTDGGVHPVRTVVGGSITLEAPASTVQVGLGITADVQTLPVTQETAAAFGQGTTKNVNEIWLRLYQSSGIKAGPSFASLREYPQRTAADNYGAPPGMITGIAQFKLDPSWQADGTVCIRQSNPLPLTLVAMTLETASGG